MQISDVYLLFMFMVAGQKRKESILGATKRITLQHPWFLYQSMTKERKKDGQMTMALAMDPIAL